MKSPPRLAAIAVALALGAPVATQAKVSTDRYTRQVTRVRFPDFGSVAIDYGPLKWRDSYATMVEPRAWQRPVPLGRDDWSYLTTAVSLSAGGTQIAPGRYCLQLQCDPDGEWSLLLVDAAYALHHRWDFRGADLTPLEPIRIALGKLGQGPASDVLRIELTSRGAVCSGLTLLPGVTADASIDSNDPTQPNRHQPDPQQPAPPEPNPSEQGSTRPSTATATTPRTPADLRSPPLFHRLRLTLDFHGHRLATDLIAALLRTPPPKAPRFRRPDPTRAQRTKSGLLFEILKPGNGIAPATGASIRFYGWLPDGTLFGRTLGQPIELEASQAIPGLWEAVRLLRPGGRILVEIPPDLAYGARATSEIPADSTLVFDVQLVAAH